jgi:hypothetical protein
MRAAKFLVDIYFQYGILEPISKMLYDAISFILLPV